MICTNNANRVRISASLLMVALLAHFAVTPVAAGLDGIGYRE